MPLVDLGDGEPPIDLPEGFTLARAKEIIYGKKTSEEEEVA